MKDYLHNIDILWDKKKTYNHRLLPYSTHDLQVGEYSSFGREIRITSRQFLFLFPEDA